MRISRALVLVAAVTAAPLAYLACSGSDNAMGGDGGTNNPFEASLPHTAQLMLAIGPYGAGGPKGDVTLPNFEAPLAVDAGFGFGNQGLSNEDIDAGGATHCNANWCGNFDTYQGQVPLYLQPLAQSSPDGGGIGSLAQLIPFAMSHHTQILEIYTGDLGVAYDPTNPNYAEYGAAYQSVFATTAQVLGAKP